MGSDGLSDAEAAAREVHARGGVAIVAVGDNSESSGEGRDRLDLTLPGAQQELVQRVAATGVPTIVVLFSGRAPAIPLVAQQA